jgi:hypothetical protein
MYSENETLCAAHSASINCTNSGLRRNDRLTTFRQRRSRSVMRAFLLVAGVGANELDYAPPQYLGTRQVEFLAKSINRREQFLWKSKSR